MAQPPVLALFTIATSAAVPMLLHRGKPISVQVSDWILRFPNFLIFMPRDCPD
ncbi:hypothetical protein SNOG_06946 [Parastagonospora nodorum SN15]|uniref:Uncharacterized protein n=1 Tax=Phaeosphaeria nodorum (strain SN15 / ATCC MYA-4574 / FGSC 10173) TaxID=321614 RepID=Q0UMR8_PHANO|nr:hypothetical protein SNOG_06946 [Parastagonospora nodorum SN15]EAT85597.1 hypothetical protein SNOG_06946 [Parastagonospora nodorum SN15]